MADPDYRGASLTPSVEYTLAATSENQVIAAAYAVMIRKVTVDFSGTGPWRVRIYDNSARTSLVFDSGSKDATTTSYEDATPRMYVDKSAATNLYLKIEGQIGDVITVSLDLFKLA